jgi:hypothetical protein
MAHFAEIDENNIVLRVLVADEVYDNDQPGDEWLTENLGGRWIQTSYNTYQNTHKLDGTPLRGNFAGIGMTYDEERDAFLYPKRFPSWVLNEEIANWEAPVSQPEEGRHSWDEETLSWIEVTE